MEERTLDEIMKYLVLSVFMAACFLFGIALIRNQKAFEEKCIHITGTIVGYENTGSTMLAAPLVRFIAYGKEHTVPCQPCRMKERDYPPGTQIHLGCKRSIVFGKEAFEVRMENPGAKKHSTLLFGKILLGLALFFFIVLVLQFLI